MKYSLGVDLGGTNIRIAVVDEEGKIHQVIKEPTRKGGIEAIIAQIAELYQKIDKDAYDLVGLGIGAPGPVASDGTVQFLANLNIDQPFSFKKLLKDIIPLPVYTGNDANVGGLAEAIVGSGKGYEIVQYITLSTGIGGGLIMNKKMITGHYGFAQEIGSMIVRIHGRQPTRFKPHGCIEGEASGTELTKKGQEAGLSVNNAGDLFHLADQHHPVAMKLKEEFIENIAAFIGSIVAYMEPDIFVIGGGMMKSSASFLEAIKERVKDYVPEVLKQHIRIVPATYDQDCGIIGAAMLCFYQGLQK